MVAMGLHNGLAPFMLQSLAQNGYERLSGPGSLPSNVAQGAAALAVALRTKKNLEFKELAFTAGLTGILGVTEPALFGVTLQIKKVLPCVMIGGGLGGLYAGITGVKCFSFCSPGLLALPAYIGTGGWTNLINAVISMLIGFIVPFVLVFVLKISGDTDETAEEIFSEEKPVKSQLGTEAA